jgi:hypothetical protein
MENTSSLYQSATLRPPMQKKTNESPGEFAAPKLVDGSGRLGKAHL